MDVIERSIRAWTMRNLTMVGKILIVKSLLVSKLSFIGSIMNLPTDFVNRVNKMFFKFVWGGSEKVKRTTLINGYDKGGLNMINLRDFLDSLKMNWIQKLNDPHKSKWKNIPLYFLSKTHLGMSIFNSNCNLKTLHFLLKIY